MNGQINPRVVGATVIGFALVAGAYTISSFNAPVAEPQQANVQAASVKRVAIDVLDNDNNGIEDWRDEFVTTNPVVLDEAASSTYTPPDTVTGQMGISFMEGIIRSKGYGPFGRTQDEVINDTANLLATETVYDLYDTPDIEIIEDWDEEDIKNYGNTIANVIFENSIPNMDGELFILHDILTTNDQSRITELNSLVEVYRGYRDDTLKVPVPAILVKQHLDLINTYHAIHQDISAMTLTFDDPAVTLLHLKRYQDDASGLAYALQNMYFGLEPYADLFVVADPAAMFAIFDPDYQLPN
tara:strand:+ start:2516 stop:3412 length:897 start_codon:yes stop_codon:yes gene_type:complete